MTALLTEAIRNMAGESFYISWTSRGQRGSCP
jgi:hypothetical protein